MGVRTVRRPSVERSALARRFERRLFALALADAPTVNARAVDASRLARALALRSPLI